MTDVSFQGNFIRKVNIEKLGLDGLYKPIKATLVELTKDDLPVTKQFSKAWNNERVIHVPDILEQSILSSELLKAKIRDYLPNLRGVKEEDVAGYLSSRVMGNHIYVVTTQGDSFQKLNPDSILGVAVFSAKPHCNDLSMLEVRPDCISENYGNQTFLLIKKAIKTLLGIRDTKPKRPYGHVGDAIIKSLQKMYNDKTMELVPLNASKSFYRRYGFHLNPESGFEYIWYPDYRS